MASKDFIKLMTKLHEEMYHVLSTEINAKKLGNSFSMIATIVLRKDGEQITLESNEIDFVQYSIGLRGVVDTDGEYSFRRVKDPNQHSTDVEYLTDKDHIKLEKAVKEVISGEFRLTYDVTELIDQLLAIGRNTKNEKINILKKDYYYILANAFLISRETLKAREELIRRYPETKRVINAVDTIMKSFWPTGNSIKDYKFYRSFLKFDFGELAKSISTELPVVDDTQKEFISRGKMDANVGILRMMGIYAQLIELAAPVINFVRIGLELKRGNTSPNSQCTLGQNIEILRSDQDYGPLFCCLDEQIRHAAAHASRRIDKAARKVYLIDARGNQRKIVRIYTFDEFCDVINLMTNQFFPAILPAIMLFDIETLYLLLVSPEYKHLLLALGNI